MLRGSYISVQLELLPLASKAFDGIGGCEKKVNATRSQALLGTTNLFRKLRQKESAAKERTKAKKLLIVFACLLLPYCENGCAVCLPFSIGTVRPYRKNSTALVRLDVC